MDSGTLANIASVIGAFGAAMLYFRIQRELQMRKAGERVWFPLADFLIFGATLASLLLVILPIVTTDPKSPTYLKLPAAACGAAAVLVAGYMFAILAHYRIYFGQSRSRPRDWAEPWEVLFSLVSIGAAGYILWAGLR